MFVKRRPDGPDGKKINKQTNKQKKERNLSFKSLSHSWAPHVQYALSIFGTGSLILVSQGFFSIL